ncbi:hypothetical protein FIV34_02250 [Luteibacter pinisoli]|uniref:Uncharacterized protein n=1 Tax=Luteibacter pinisoli TaxID=2589080 RepID=A0A4Y5YYK9_9GAMM|nr:hypothetical protein [Luteibacter pinisoli]QDE38100.1 hypothetical protein FIV34_02250 [Luteibacter pinisoli]
MNTTHRVLLTAVLFAGAFAPAWAGSLAITRLHLDQGNVVALLEASSQRHVEVMRSIVQASYPGEHDARRWEIIENHARRVPIARVSYEYPVGGGTGIRTYHAVGGEPLTRVAAQAFGGRTPPATPSSAGSSPLSPTWSEDDDSPPLERVSDDELVAAEAADASHYIAMDDTDIRAPFRPSERTVMKPYWHQGSYHALDPEQKAMRALEDDILDGKLPRGGKVHAWLSSVVCATCRRPLERMAEAYDLEVTFTEMVPFVPTHITQAEITAGRGRMKAFRLVHAESGMPLGAFDALDVARDAQVRQALSPVAIEPPLRGGSSPMRTFRLGPPRPRRVTEGSSASGAPPQQPVDEAGGC